MNHIDQIALWIRRTTYWVALSIPIDIAIRHYHHTTH